MKKWISEKWQHGVVYGMALFGAFCQMVYVSRLAGARFKLDWLYIVLGVVTSAAATWLAENRGIAFAQKLGVIKNDPVMVADTIKSRKEARSRNIGLRVILGFVFGFVGMAALPNILQWMQNGAPAFVNGVLTGNAQ